METTMHGLRSLLKYDISKSVLENDEINGMKDLELLIRKGSKASISYVENDFIFEIIRNRMPIKALTYPDRIPGAGYHQNNKGHSSPAIYNSAISASQSHHFEGRA
jgi:hypothetical protein